MQSRRGPRAHARDRAEEVEQDVDGVDALVDQRAAPRVPASRAIAIRVVSGGGYHLTWPNARIGVPSRPASMISFIQTTTGLRQSEEDAELDARLAAASIGASSFRGRDVNRFFDEDMEAAPRRGDPLLGVQARRTADGDEDASAMVEKAIQIVVHDATDPVGETAGLVMVGAVEGGNLDARDGFGRPAWMSLMLPPPRMPI